MKKIILCGPPRSGKSCLREGLKQAIRAIPGAPYPYVITACPDGEGAWFQETVNQDPALAATCKAAYKAKFTPEFVKRVADSVLDCSLELTLVDIGGITSVENEAICASATHAVILAGDLNKVAEWEEFCRKVGLTVIAEIHSDYHGTKDTVPVQSDDGICRGSVHHLERGEKVSDRPTIKALAEILVK
jgi:CRISPR-associated protein Csx3